MNKSELIEQVVKRVPLSKSQAAEVLNATLDIIQGTVSRGGEVKLVGFGTFLQSERKSRSARNPKTGLMVQIPACRVPKFRPSKGFRGQGQISAVRDDL